MADKKKLMINCINRVKIEEFEEFGDSIFIEVYKKAVRYTRVIVEDGIRWKDDIQNETFLSMESYNNIIPFLGDRGMGKSSAMLSFALFLKKYNAIKRKLPSEYQLSESKEIDFYLLPRIDAAMLVKGENLLDIVLASMWRIFEDKQFFGNKQESVRKRFLNLKNSYELYVNTITGKEKGTMASVRDLRDLSRCLNLAQDFKELVDSFLPCVSQSGCDDTFLVITLDDVDTATEDVYAVMEQIRLFLMFPNIIILLSADLGRLYLECNKYFLKKLGVESQNLQKEEEQIRQYAHGYLAKMLPSNRRIYMPDVNMDNEQEYEIAIPQLELREEHSIKKTIYQLIYKCAGIMLFPYKRTNMVLQYRTLREIVNVLYMTETIASMENGKKAEMIHWLISRMEEYVEAYNDMRYFNCLKGSLNTELAYMNEFVSMLRNSVRTSNSGIRIRYSEKLDYEMMIKILYELSSSRYDLPDEVFDFLTLLYSIRLSELCADDVSIFFGKVNMRGIWRASINTEKDVDVYPLKNVLWVNEEEETDKISADKIQLKFLELDFDKDDSFMQWLQESKVKVVDSFSKALFCDQNIWYSEKENYVRYKLKNSPNSDLDGQNVGESKNERYYFTLEGDYTEASIDCFLSNMVLYDECWYGFVKNLYDAYSEGKECPEDFSTDVVDKILNRKKFKRLKEAYSIQSLKDILPLEQVEIMNELTIAIDNIAVVRKMESMTEQVIDRICRQVERIIEILETVDRYYEVGKNSYGVRIGMLYRFWKDAADKLKRDEH